MALVLVQGRLRRVATQGWDNRGRLEPLGNGAAYGCDYSGASFSCCRSSCSSSSKSFVESSLRFVVLFLSKHRAFAGSFPPKIRPLSFQQYLVSRLRLIVSLIVSSLGAQELAGRWRVGDKLTPCTLAYCTHIFCHDKCRHVRIWTCNVRLYAKRLTLSEGQQRFAMVTAAMH